MFLLYFERWLQPSSLGPTIVGGHADALVGFAVSAIASPRHSTPAELPTSAFPTKFPRRMTSIFQRPAAQDAKFRTKKQRLKRARKNAFVTAIPRAVLDTRR